MLLGDGVVWIWNVLPTLRETFLGKLILLMWNKAMAAPVKSARKGRQVLSKLPMFPIFMSRLKFSTMKPDAAGSYKHLLHGAHPQSITTQKQDQHLQMQR
jgi:hypothetical protein